MKTLITTAALVALFILPASSSLAERLPKNAVCDKICVPHVQPGVERKTCYEVGYEEICVPGFRLPWSKCCEPVGGYVIRVKVLKQRTYECPTCDTEWNIEHAPCAHGHCPPACHHGHVGQIPARTAPAVAAPAPPSFPPFTR